MMKANGIAVADLDEAQAVALVARTRWNPKRKIAATFIVMCFVRFLAERGVGTRALPPTAKEIARAELKRDYETYVRRQRGLSERTILHSWCIADRFLEFHFEKEIGDLSRITTTDIVGFLQHLTTRTPPLRDKTLSSHLRNFFRHPFKAGKTATNLALAIPSVTQRYGTRLPRHLTTEQVDTLVRAVRTDSAGGRRNYAVVMLLARLRLRAPEVIAMQREDIDWRSGEIIVRGKGNRHDRVPLPPDVGEVLADYIKSDRKTALRALFVTERSPHRPFKDGQIPCYAVHRITSNSSRLEEDRARERSRISLGQARRSELSGPDLCLAGEGRRGRQLHPDLVPPYRRMIRRDRHTPRLSGGGGFPALTRRAISRATDHRRAIAEAVFA
jgi:integrase